MGLFSGKKRTYVSSSVWNLAGDIKDRSDFLKTTVAASVLLESNSSMGESIPRSYINGPGMGLRRYANWAKGPSNYNDDVGFLGGGVSIGSSVDPLVVAANIPHGANEIVVLNEYGLGLSDPDWWAQQYMTVNYQSLLFTEWYSEFNPTTGLITITFASGSTQAFAPTSFNPTANSLYALYSVVTGGTTGPIVLGPVVTVASEAAYPPVPAGYSLYSTVTTTASIISTYHKFTAIDYSTSTRAIYVREEKLTPTVKFEYHFDTQTVTNDVTSPYRYFIYKQGTGNAALDALFISPGAAEQYLPFIPMRIDGNFLRDTDPALYGRTKRAFFRATGGSKLDKVIDNVAGNEQIGDIDFVYAVFGTSLNSPENTARNYMYQFFNKLKNNSPGSSADFTQWEIQWALADASMIAYREWASANTSGGGEAPPVVIPYPPLPVVKMDIQSTTDSMNFHMSIRVNGIKELSGSGLHTGKKVGDYWIEALPSKQYNKTYVSTSTEGGGTANSTDYIVTVERLAIYHQISAGIWEGLEILGLEHRNYVYDGKWVVITGSEAIADTEESGFIIPIHGETLRDMRLVDSTQMATACCYLVFNCYTVVKSKWYQSSLFKVITIVGVVVLSVVFAPAGAGSAGVLGSSATVGASLGFTGTAAIVAGTVANALAAIVITKALTAAVGDKLGPILGAVVTLALTSYGGIGGSGAGLDAGSVMSELSKADNLIAITDGLVKSASAFINDKTASILAETQKMMDQYKQDMLEVTKRYDEMFGGNGTGVVIDPMQYTNAGYTGMSESRGAFIERTLMCGSDIAEMTHDLVRNFTKVTLSLDLPS